MQSQTATTVAAPPLLQIRATPQEVKAHLAGLSVELLEFHEIPEALQYRESLSLRKEVTVPPKP